MTTAHATPTGRPATPALYARHDAPTPLLLAVADALAAESRTVSTAVTHADRVRFASAATDAASRAVTLAGEHGSHDALALAADALAAATRAHGIVDALAR